MIVTQKPPHTPYDNNCNNCGQVGHIYKHCTEPITSYGIIAFYRDEQQHIKYLEINRKHSICFIEFVRGRYVSNKQGSMSLNVKYAIYLFTNMTKSERVLVETLSFVRHCTPYHALHLNGLRLLSLFKLELISRIISVEPSAR